MTERVVGGAHPTLFFSAWLCCAGALAGLCPGIAAAEEGALPAPKLVRQGNKLLAEKRYVEALQKYKAAEVSAPDAPEVAYNRGLALYRLDRFDDAESAFQDAIKPDRPKLEAGAKYNLGRCAQAAAMAGMDKEQAAINDLSRAIGFYEDALKLNPDDAAAVSNKSKAERMITYLQKRLEQKQQQQQKDPKRPSSQPTSRPTSQPNRPQPTSQPSSQPTSQPNPPQNQPQSGDKQDSEQDKSPQSKKDKSQQGEQKDADQKSGKANEDRKMSEEEAERFLQQARDAERRRREQKRRRAMRLRGRIPVKKDW